MSWLLFYFSSPFLFFKREAGNRSNGRGRRQAEVLVTLGVQVDYWGCSPGACPPRLPFAHNPTPQPRKTRGSVNKVIQKAPEEVRTTEKA